MQKFIILSFITLLLSPSYAQAKKPNIILILADDLGYGDLSCYGSKNIRSPHIDKMTKDGMKFLSFYPTSASCTPSRASIMTGSYAGRIGMDNVLMPGSKDKHTGKHLGLNPSEITIAEIVKGKGYATACIGKWHLGDDPIFMPQNHGFDEFFGLPYSNDMVPPRFVDLPLMRNDKILELNPDQDYITRRYTEESIAFIERNREKPFFLYLAHSMPHRACHASPEFTKRFTEAQLKKIKPGEDKASRDFLYPASVEELDWSTGQILNKLRELGLEENTLVIFTSDNGPKTGSAAPLRGKKGSVYEGGHRVPAIMQWKGRIPAGSVSDEVVTGMDFLPTFAKLVGVDLPTDRILDGHNCLPIMEAKPDAKSFYEAFYFTHGGMGVRSGKWKFIRGKKGGLYDLSMDIREKKNLAKQYPEVAQKLDGLITKFTAELKLNSRSAGKLPE